MYKLGWLVEGQIISFKTIDDFTLEEVKEASPKVYDMMESSQAEKCHLLIDESDLKSMAFSIKVFTEVATFLRHKRMGWLVIYGTDDRFAKFMSTVISTITKIDHRRYDTLQESLEFLVHIDKSLPDLSDIISQNGT